MLKYKLTKKGNKFFIKSIEKATILAIFTKVKLGESLNFMISWLWNFFKDIARNYKMRKY